MDGADWTIQMNDSNYWDGYYQGKEDERETCQQESEGIVVEVRHFATAPHYRHAWPDQWAFSIGETHLFRLIRIPEGPN